MVAAPRIRRRVRHKLRTSREAMLCCGRKKDGNDQPVDMGRSPRHNHQQEQQQQQQQQRQQQQQQQQQGAAQQGPSGSGMPQMVVQKDFRKVSGISTEIFRQIETVENDLDASTAAALQAVEKRGEMLVRILDPNRLSKKAFDNAKRFLALQDGRHTIQFVEIVKRPGQTLGLYIREGNGADRADGVFVSRIALESAVYNSGCLRVGDEVLAVNLVDVTRMGLDDVVIIMSIPRRLVLTTRQRRYQQGAESPPMTRIEPKPPPVVVIKKELEEDDEPERAPPPPSTAPPPLPPRRQRSADDSPYGYTRSMVHRDAPTAAAYPDPYGRARRSQFAGATSRSLPPSDSWHSDASSVASYQPPPPLVVTEQPQPRGPTPLGAPYDRSQHPKTLESLAERVHGGPLDSLAGNVESLYAAARRGGYGSLPRGGGQYRGARGRGADRGRGVTRTYSDQRLPLTDSDPGDFSMPPAMRPNFKTSSLQYPLRYTDTMKRLSAMRRRTASLDYASDSEAVAPGRPPLTHRTRPQQLAASGGPRSNSLPRDGRGVLRGRPGYASGYGSAGTGDSQDESDGAVSAPELLTRRAGPPSMRTAGTGYAAADPSQWLSRAPSTSAIYERIRSQRDAAGLPASHRGVRFTFSAENLHGGVEESPYYSYRPQLTAMRAQAPAAGQVPPRRPSAAAAAADAAAAPLSQRLRSLLEERSMTPTPQPGQASRFSVLNINPAEFLRYKSERTSLSGGTEEGPSGMLWVHLLSGRGLKPAGRMQHLRDLYCVLECDHVHKARTVIRTGDLVFDWDETFELDLINTRELDFLIYSWDPQFRHKLCYKGSVCVASLLRESSVYQLALKVEPHGTLYVKLRYTEPKRCFERTPNPRKSALFGVDLETVVARENSGLSVPLIVKRCVDEVERRGLDIIGLYRLCGSATKKLLLREAFEKSPRTVDLSPDNVPDINVITGVLKDYLRELPEPLFTKCLYQMLCDALSVCLPDDPEGNAKLMFSILDCLPKINRCTLLFLMDHLRLVASQSECNKMTPQNVAICFGPVLMLHSEIGRTEIDFHKPISVLKYLLTIWPPKSVREAAAARAVPARRSRLSPRPPSSLRRDAAAAPSDRSDPATTATDSGSESRDSSPNQPADARRPPGLPPPAPPAQRPPLPPRPPGRLRPRHAAARADDAGAAGSQPFPGPPAAPSYMRPKSDPDGNAGGRDGHDAPTETGYARPQPPTYPGAGDPYGRSTPPQYARGQDGRQRAPPVDPGGGGRETHEQMMKGVISELQSKRLSARSLDGEAETAEAGAAAEERQEQGRLDLT